MRAAVGATPAWLETGFGRARPAGQRSGGVGRAAESPAGVDEPGGVFAIGVGELVDILRRDASGRMSGDLGAFRGVFSQVAGLLRGDLLDDDLIGKAAVCGEHERLDVDLVAPGDRPAGRL